MSKFLLDQMDPNVFQERHNKNKLGDIIDTLDDGKFQCKLCKRYFPKLPESHSRFLGNEYCRMCRILTGG